MSNKQMKEVGKLSLDELTTKVREVEAKIFEARMRKATGSLENTASVWMLRKELARMKTAQTKLASQARGK